MSGIFANGYRDLMDQAQRSPVQGDLDTPSSWSEATSAAITNFRNENLSSSWQSKYMDQLAARDDEVRALGEDPVALGPLFDMPTHIKERLLGWLDDGSIVATEQGFSYRDSIVEEWGTSFALQLRGLAHLRELRGKYGDKIRSDQTMADNIKRETLAIKDRTGRIVARGPTSAKVIGTGLGAITDPLILATLPLGGGFQLGRGFLVNAGRALLIESSIATVAEIPIQMKVYDFKQFLGVEWTAADAAVNILGAAAGAGILRGAGSLTIDSALSALGKYKTVVKVNPALRNAETEAARKLLQTWVDVAEESPLVARSGGAVAENDPLGANAAAVSTAHAQLQAGQAVSVGKIVEDFEPAPEFRAAEGVNDLESLDPTALEVDAKTFQFKADVDAEGVSPRLKGLDRFDARLAGVAIVWESKAGRRFIVDGHQRVALAKRAVAAGQDPAQVRQASYVLREVDGVTPADARQVAAIKNIAEGTGAPIDAAKVLRDLGPAGEAMLPPLPPFSALVRQARGLATLDDQAFEKIVNKVIDERYGAIVGELVEDGKLQNAAIEVLKRTGPANQVQARAIVEQVRTAGLEVRVTEDLFGAQTISESLYLERAKVLDSALKLARRDKATFGTLVKRESTISETGGNQLDRAANEAKINQSALALTQITKLANLTGPVSDALTKAASQVKKGKRPGEVADAFLETVKREIIGGDQPGRTTGRARPADEAAAARFIDLLEEDTRAQQAVADETSRLDRLRNAGQESIETGDPNDLFSAARKQADLVDEVDRIAAITEADELADLHGDFLQVADEVLDTADGLGFVRARPAREIFDELDDLERGMDDLTRCAFPHRTVA